jgi:hypothetical protein
MLSIFRQAPLGSVTLFGEGAGQPGVFAPHTTTTSNPPEQFFFLFRTENQIDPDAAERGGIDAEPRDTAGPDAEV